jgi:hypothetical protein
MISIYEPLYAKGQELTEPAFKPLVLSDNSQADWREFRIMVDFYRRGDHRSGMTGIFSPKFGLKTKIAASDFLEFCEKHPEAEVCLINPFPQIAFYSFNVWTQGEANHPGLTERAQNLLRAAGVDLDIPSLGRNSSKTLCYSNFWVGTPAFWNLYVGGVLEPIARFLETFPDSSISRSVMESTWHTDGAPFLPFIIERLFSSFLSSRPDISVAAFDLPDAAEYCLTDFERELTIGMRPIVDAADSLLVFPPELRHIQEMLCRLTVIHGRQHFESNVHPHTGRRVAKSD